MPDMAQTNCAVLGQESTYQEEEEDWDWRRWPRDKKLRHGFPVSAGPKFPTSMIWHAFMYVHQIIIQTISENSRSLVSGLSYFETIISPNN